MGLQIFSPRCGPSHATNQLPANLESLVASFQAVPDPMQVCIIPNFILMTPSRLLTAPWFTLCGYEYEFLHIYTFLTTAALQTIALLRNKIGPTPCRRTYSREQG